MKFRVKQASGGQALRVEVADGTFGGLNRAVADSLGLLDVSALRLSLNRKVNIVAGGEVLLTELGLCSGDLLWITAPAPSACAEPPAPQPPQPAATTAPQQPRRELQPCEAGRGCDDVQPDAEMAPVEQVGGGQGAEALPPGQTIPGILLRTLRRNAGTATTPAGVLLLAAHAAMLENGFRPASFAALPSSKDIYAISAGCQVSSSVYRIAYCLPPDNIDASSSGAGGGVACTLTCSSMGDSLVVAACTPSGAGGTRHVTLGAADCITYRAPPTPDASTSAAAAGQPAAVQVRDDRHLVVHGTMLLGGAPLRTLWTLLKDGVAFPMLLAACAAAGLPPPLGLLALPTEVSQRVLGALSAPDLAALSATCTQLRHSASGDALWRPLLDAEFPSPPAHIAPQTKARGCKWAFGQCWRERAQREREASEARRRHRQRFMPVAPMFGPRPPFYPAPAPPGFPGIIGGDQDRLPFLGGGGVYPPYGRGGLGPDGFGLGSRGEQGRGRGGGVGGFPGF